MDHFGLSRKIALSIWNGTARDRKGGRPKSAKPGANRPIVGEPSRASLKTWRPETWQLHVWHPGFQSRISPLNATRPIKRFIAGASVASWEMPRCSTTYFTPICVGFATDPESDRPDFNIDRDGPLSQKLVQPPVNFPTPESEVLLQSAPPTGLVNFVAEQPSEVPGFRVGLRDEVPGFNLNENDLPHPETTWPDGLETPLPESSDTAQTLALPPGVEEPDQPTPQLPEWLRNVLAMPVPQLSTAFDPQTGRRIVPYEPLINWTRPYPSVDQNVRGPDAAEAYGPEIGAMPESVIARSAGYQTIGTYCPTRETARTSIPAPTLPTPRRRKRWNSWPQPLNDGQTDTHTSGVDVEDPWRDGRATAAATDTDFRKNSSHNWATFQRQRSARTRPASSLRHSIGPSPIEHSVYSPDIDPGYDELFDLVRRRRKQSPGRRRKGRRSSENQEGVS